MQDRVLLGSRAYMTVGGRVERNGSFGTQAVPRAALAARLRDGDDATTLRASAGMGIKEPSFLESYGESFRTPRPDGSPTPIWPGGKDIRYRPISDSEVFTDIRVRTVTSDQVK